MTTGMGSQGEATIGSRFFARLGEFQRDRTGGPGTSQNEIRLRVKGNHVVNASLGNNFFFGILEVCTTIGRALPLLRIIVGHFEVLLDV